MNALDKIRHTPRLYMESPLAAGHAAEVSAEQAHYLLHVLRVKAGEVLRLFNARDGEWLAEVKAVAKRDIEIVPQERLRELKPGGDLLLCAAPIKKAHFEYMIEKATELGVSAIQPMLTERTQIREVNIERTRAIAIEAAEQSDRLDIPDICKPVTLGDLIAQWPKDRLPIVCAEWGEAQPAAEALTGFAGKAAKVAIITGPEGGFAAAELEALRKLPNAVFIRLGPRILRADTAAIAALTLWQASVGDWR
jgi:16S rRNA (uracil1498-N3)-methyltransferase